MTVIDDLVSSLGTDRVFVDPDVLNVHRRDCAAFVDAGMPAVLVRPQTMAEIAATLRVATAHRTPVVTRAAGTGLVGGANALDGCIVLSTMAMTRILDIDVAGRTATVEAGVLTAALGEAVAAHGLWYPPDPASKAISTIGGNIATNAGGGCCLKYGVTGDHVAALTAVLADGTVIRTGATTRKNVAGLDLTRLLVGSEGTLAVIAEATVRLRPAAAAASTLVAFFASTVDAGAAVVAMGETADLSLLELMDRTTIAAVEKLTHLGLDTTAGAVLIAQCDAAGGAGYEGVERCALACRVAGATDVVQTADPAEGERLLAARRAALPAFDQLGVTLLDDVAVPVPAIPSMLAAIDEIAGRHGVLVGTFGHAGDGNLHPTIVFDPADPHSAKAARRTFDEIMKAALTLGGTITGEHGIGTLKRAYLGHMLGDAERALMSRIKAAFDPLGILNPGKAI